MKMFARIVIFMVILSTCVNTELQSPSPCNAQSDCKPNECCINKDRPIGRRSGEQYAGYCLQLGVVDSVCYVRYGSAARPPDYLVFGCPCTTPLMCKGNGTFDIPLGELGFCEKQC